jgi:hypothetical protein
LCTTAERLRLPVAAGRAEGDAVPARRAVCVACGRPFSAGVGELLLAKLAQLARFGLAGGPLLVERHR